MSHKKVDRDKMFEVTGVNSSAIRDILNFDNLCTASTVQEAMEDMQDAPLGSIKELAAGKAWDELSMKEVEAANSVEEIIAALEGAREQSDAYLKAIKKLAPFFTKK